MKKKLFIVLLLIILIAGVATIFSLSLNKDEDNPSNSKKSKITIKTLDYNELQEMEDVEIYLDEDKDYKDIFLTGDFSNNIVKDEKDALQELNEVKDLLGISNVDKEFKTNIPTEVREYKYYRMQQYYEDILVDGMQLIVSTDKEGNIESITGNYLKIDDLEIEPEIKEDELEEIIEEKYGENTKVESKDLIIEEIDRNIVLTWRCFVSGGLKGLEEDAYYIHLDANNGSILNEEDVLVEAKKEETKCSANINGEMVEFDASKYEDEEKYVLEDIRRKITIEGNVNSSNKDSWNDINSVIAYVNAQKVYDYYKNVLWYELSEKGPIYIKTNVKNLNNANCGFFLLFTRVKTGTGDGINYGNFGNSLDIMAHELTHSYVAQQYNGMIEMAEINEGYADAIGCCIENYWNNTEDDWLHGEDVAINDICTRNLEDPESMGRPSVVGGKYYDSSFWADEHHNCTILGHTAYLMHEKGFTINEIAMIFADSCQDITKKAEYQDVGRALILQCTIIAPKKKELLNEILFSQNIIDSSQYIKYSNRYDLPSISDKANEEFEKNKNDLSTNDVKENISNANTFIIDNNTLHYGKYSGSGTKVIDTRVAEATITITLNEDKTYTYESTNQEVCKNHSGNWEIKDNKLILQGENALEYRPLSDDSFIELQGSGFTFLYVEDSNESVTTTSSKEIKVGDTYVKCGTYNGDAALVGDVLIINDNGTASLNGKEYTYTIGEQNIAQDRSTGDIIEDVILFNGENDFYLYALDDGTRLSQGSGFDYVYSGK